MSAGVEFVLPIDEDRRALQDGSESTGLVFKPKAEQELQFRLAFQTVLSKQLRDPGADLVRQSDEGSVEADVRMVNVQFEQRGLPSSDRWGFVAPERSDLHVDIQFSGQCRKVLMSDQHRIFDLLFHQPGHQIGIELSRGLKPHFIKRWSDLPKAETCGFRRDCLRELDQVRSAVGARLPGQGSFLPEVVESGATIEAL